MESKKAVEIFKGWAAVLGEARAVRGGACADGVHLAVPAREVVPLGLCNGGRMVRVELRALLKFTWAKNFRTLLNITWIKNFRTRSSYKSKKLKFLM